MHHIRANAEMSVRNLLRDVAKRAGTHTLSAVDYLDDGSPVSLNILRSISSYIERYQICLKVEINEKEGSAILDFAGTGSEVRGNLNAPISVVHSAVIYCMRAMLDVDIPLNAGCLVPLDGMFSSALSLMANRSTFS
jgi:5-oxoprolinase (ATP-hydrolysing)